MRILVVGDLHGKIPKLRKRVAKEEFAIIDIDEKKKVIKDVGFFR